MSKELLNILQKKYGRVISYEAIPSYKKNEYYFFNVDIFKKPMFIFHFLRKSALFFNGVARFLRKIIYENTERKEGLEFYFKEGEK